MRISISNIAWEPTEDDEVAELLRHYDINAIDIAPGKYFSNPATTRDEDILKVKQWWQQQGIEIVGMQALLFGTTGLNIFSSQDSRDNMLAHLSAICRIAGGLGAKELVFGSPNNRKKGDLTTAQAHEIAIPFFTQLGDIAITHGVEICLEPNPTFYGADFMTNCIETANVVRATDHRAIRMQLDTGALTLNHESVNIVYDDIHLVGHIHASEPKLIPLGDGETDHKSIAEFAKQHLPDHIVTIEMLATTDEPHLQSIERALKTAVQYYR